MNKQLSIFDQSPGKDHPAKGKSDPDSAECADLGKRYPAKGKPDPGRRIYLDFSPVRGLAIAVDDGPPTWADAHHLLDFIDGYASQSPTSGDTVILETNFEMHQPRVHNRVIDLAEQLDITLQVLPLRVTGKYKIAIEEGFGPVAAHKEDDFTAVEAIRWAHKDGQHTSTPRREQKLDLSDIEMFNRLRTAGLLAIDNDWVSRRLEWLPLPAVFRRSHPNEAGVLLQDGEWQVPVVLLGTIAAQQSDSRKDYERRLGLYAHGYPGIYRSTIVRRAAVLAKRRADISNISLRQNPEGREAWKAARTQTKRAMRLLYHLYNAAQ